MIAFATANDVAAPAVARANKAVPDFEPWFGRLVDPVSPPTTGRECVDRYVVACIGKDQKDIAELAAAVPAADRAAAERAFLLYYMAVTNTPDMECFLERWFTSRELGIKCPPENALYMPRESGYYATTMPSATPEEEVMLATYDETLRALLVDEPIEVLTAGVIIAYMLPLAGLESKFTERLWGALEPLSNDRKREVLAMQEHCDFESADIAEMTRISVGEATKEQVADGS